MVLWKGLFTRSAVGPLPCILGPPHSGGKPGPGRKCDPCDPGIFTTGASRFFNVFTMLLNVLFVYLKRPHQTHLASTCSPLLPFLQSTLKSPVLADVRHYGEGVTSSMFWWYSGLALPARPEYCHMGGGYILFHFKGWGSRWSCRRPQAR